MVASYHRDEYEASGPCEIAPITISMLCGVLWEQSSEHDAKRVFSYLDACMSLLSSGFKN